MEEPYARRARHSASPASRASFGEAEGRSTMAERVDGAGERGKLAAAISNAITGLHREYYGRGASRTRTVMGADYIICFMEDVYTPVERTLIDAGKFAAVQETRSAFQDTMREKFSTAVEEAVGRKVIGFLSQVHVDPDLSIETFILEPDGKPQTAAEGDRPRTVTIVSRPLSRTSSSITSGGARIRTLPERPPRPTRTP